MAASTPILIPEQYQCLAGRMCLPCIFFYQKVYEENKHDVVIIIVCKDDNGVNQTYALKIDDPDVLFAAISQDVQNNPKIKSNDTREKILDNMDADLTILYAKNGTSREKPFLERFANFGISLYKADEDLTTWNKLILENGIVKPIPCN
ncbi:hypothetical protein [Chryseobacterium gambrini]|uniref:hypothetical protein n=1 Tax=Chryseobacterium gambrini TaxID=373672 RepID=UPI0022F3CF63|nr:hypothetical protein [Chryseobacterium gambrini]WBX95917.1 hypothetical protein PE065_13650 [Chryseobacterium gambrini]